MPFVAPTISPQQMERIVRARKFVQGEFYRAKALQELGDDKLAKEALANGKEVQKEVDNLLV